MHILRHQRLSLLNIFTVDYLLCFYYSVLSTTFLEEINLPSPLSSPLLFTSHILPKKVWKGGEDRTRWKVSSHGMADIPAAGSSQPDRAYLYWQEDTELLRERDLSYLSPTMASNHDFLTYHYATIMLAEVQLQTCCQQHGLFLQFPLVADLPAAWKVTLIILIKFKWKNLITLCENRCNRILLAA